MKIQEFHKFQGVDISIDVRWSFRDSFSGFPWRAHLVRRSVKKRVHKFVQFDGLRRHVRSNFDSLSVVSGSAR